MRFFGFQEMFLGHLVSPPPGKYVDYASLNMWRLESLVISVCMYPHADCRSARHLDGNAGPEDPPIQISSPKTADTGGPKHFFCFPYTPQDPKPWRHTQLVFFGYPNALKQERPQTGGADATSFYSFSPPLSEVWVLVFEQLPTSLLSSSPPPPHLL